MNPKILLVSSLLFCGVSAAPATGTDRAGEDAAAEGQALLELYFGKEQLVEAATRNPKPVSQVAEDVTVITAREIEAMHAHSVAEVLERVPGVFVLFAGRDFATIASPSIHGSDYEHILVLVDGIRWNEVGGDFPRSNQIPVETIDRIEVIKGAASSTWGSALGGVVNIITQKTGSARHPHGSALVGIGEHGTDHEYGEANGAAGALGYYLYAGHRDSDGIRDERSFRDTNLFGKMSYQFPNSARLTAAIGASEPAFRYLYAPAFDSTAAKDERVRWYAASLESPLTEALHFFLQAYDRDNRSAEAASLISTGELVGKLSFEEEQRGVNSRLAWEKGRHTVVLGAEYVDRDITGRDELIGVSSATLTEEMLALYLNDTIRRGDFTVTPGLRYDSLTIADDEVSPSMGVTWGLSGRTLLRAAASRGFRKPPLGLKELPAGDPPYNTPNPALASETIWTYQAGVETTAVPWVWLKATLFRHEAEKVWTLDDAGVWINGGQVKRTGLEASLKTASFHDVSFGANYTLVHLAPEGQESDDLYKVDVLFEYHHREWGLQAQLFGRYVWWSDVLFSPPEDEGRFDTFLWDLTLHQLLSRGAHGELSLFFKVHNLFNGSHYAAGYYPNAPRWLEGGLHLRF